MNMVKLKQRFEFSNTKRRLASREGCMHDLEEELPLFFKAYNEACDDYNREVIQTPPESRCRGFEASLLNSKLIQAFQKHFPNDWKFGKYRRFILSKKGYLVLVKKLNGKGMPMNIQTRIVELINLQMTESLFDSSNSTEEPILYFGYKKDRTGNIVSPQIVYVDENQVRWFISEADVTVTTSSALTKPESTKDVAEPVLRTDKKKAVNQ